VRSYAREECRHVGRLLFGVGYLWGYLWCALRERLAERLRSGRLPDSCLALSQSAAKALHQLLASVGKLLGDDLDKDFGSLGIDAAEVANE
jgi:hypothetical protein